MRLFNYLQSGTPAAGRVAGQWGIDLSLAVEEYVLHHRVSHRPGMNPLHSLVDWLAGEPESVELARISSDWILDQLPGSEDEIRQKRILFDLAHTEFLPPTALTGKVICIAGNYPAPGKMEKPAFPTVFLKPASGITLDHSPVRLPAITENVACEVELAVLIGRTGRNLSPRCAHDCVAGLTVANDLGDRVLEKRTSQWTSGKMFDTFTPISPFVVTPDESNCPGNLAMNAKINGERVQMGNTSEMFFDVPALMVYLSELTTLQPGDVILTGSPKLIRGEPQPAVSLKPGDEVEVSIEGLGSVVNTVISEGQAQS